MKKTRFTETQIVGAIKKQEGGTPIKEICRELGISEQTFYNWKGIPPSGSGNVITGYATGALYGTINA